MANEKLDNLVKIGKLKTEKAEPDEVDGLIRSGVTRLTDAGNEILNIEP